MAATVPPSTWKRGFAAPTDVASWSEEAYFIDENGDKAHYSVPQPEEPLTSTVHNDLGQSVLRTWPTAYNGTESPNGVPAWWKPAKEVDVLISGGGPFGLEVALGLARQGVTFRIIDKAASALLAGRADGIQPRALELLHSWGIAQEVHEEGPILNSTILYRNGEKLVHQPSSKCDSCYRGIHVITQGQMEKIYIRDLLRHKALVERCTVVEEFKIDEDASSSSSHPVTVTLRNINTGAEETVRAKYLIGADGAASSIREQLKIDFDGISTDVYWAIMDCVFKTDYPHILGFNVIISAEHGGVIIIPRENGYTRIYTQINGEKARKLAETRKARRNAAAVGETRIDDHGITANEVLEQLNKIMAPHTVEFASAMSWFAVWKVSERVARTFSSPDLRVHIGGDAAVLGAFGLNSSIYDAANLSWKLGLCIRKAAIPSVLLPTYDEERRLFANRVIRCSGAYLRFICNLNYPLAELRGLGGELETHEENLPVLDGSKGADLDWLHSFFGRNAMFLIGMEGPVVQSAICPPAATAATDGSSRGPGPVSMTNGARAPNPRVCLDTGRTSYLYERMTGAARFHVLVFASDLRGPVRARVARLSREGFGPGGFYERFGAAARFNVVLVLKALPYEGEELLARGDGEDELEHLRACATVVYDDRVPDEDAHYWYGINHARGAVAVVRPDLWVGMSAWPEDTDAIYDYFAGFLLAV